MADQGLRVTIFQKAKSTFSARLRADIEVQGICVPDRFWGNFLFTRQLNRRLSHDIPVVFVSQELLVGSANAKAVAVNHGIWWDSDFPQWKRAINKWIQAETIRRASCVICVDTNYINWCHAEIPRRLDWREKMKFIPNYADEAAFRAGTSHRSDGRPKILCPRRMPDKLGRTWDGRGALLLLEALALLSAAGVGFDVEFAGTGEARKDVIEFAHRHGFGDRVSCTQYELDEMPRAYQQADIVVVPSASHEGTSLAAVEGLCAGKPTVVTHIGGLPNLIIEGLNGFVSDLSPPSLAEAIRRAMQSCGNRDISDRVAHGAGECFGKTRWGRRVLNELATALELPRDGDGLEARPWRTD
jgi:glycosyltransferase involved in cell wall biosynthesis